MAHIWSTNWDILYCIQTQYIPAKGNLPLNCIKRTQSWKQRAICPLKTMDINSKQQNFSKQQRFHFFFNKLHTKQKMLTSFGSNASVMSNVTTSLPTATAKLLYIFGFLVEIKWNGQKIQHSTIHHFPWSCISAHKKYNKTHAILKNV